MITRIILICVNYNTENDTRSFIEGLRQLPRSGEVDVVIANNSAKNQEDLLFKNLESTNTFVVNLPENLGYFGGAQAAWEWYQKNKLPADPSFRPLVIVSNVDIEFPDPSFFEKLFGLQMDELAEMPKMEKKIGVVAASITSGLSDQDCNPYLSQRPSPLRMHFYKWIFANYWTCQFYQLLGLIKLLLKSTLKLKNSTATTSPSTSTIYAAHGCMMIFTPHYLAAGGNFRHGAFLYGEEITVAEFCRQHKLRTVHYPQIKARHREHGSTGWFYSRKTIDFIGQSSRYIADTYFS